MNKIIVFFFLILPTFIISQNDCEKYIKNYIPIDLNDAISYFECKTSKDDLNTFKNKKENDATSSLHFETGMSIRNNWKLWAGTSEISKFFRNLGIHHPDDMSSIILKSLHKKLNNKEIELQSQVKYYQDYWEKSKQREIERKKKIFNKFKIGNKVEFLYNYDFVSKRQEKKYMNDKCFAKGVIMDLNPNKFQLKIKLKKSCDRKGIIILKGEIYTEINGKWKNTEETKVEIMKKGDLRWTNYDLWELLE